MARREDPIAAVARYTGLAFLLPAGTIAGYFIGVLLDRALGTGFLQIVFLILGIVAGFLALFRELDRQMKRNGS